MISNIAMFIVWFLVWLFMVWPPEIKDVVMGALVSLFVLCITVNILKDTRDSTSGAKGNLLTYPLRFIWFLWYIVVFLWECVKANIDVAYRVAHPGLPIRPGTIKVKVGLKSDMGLTFLANSITLTPGTTTVDVDKDNGFLYVHRLCAKEPYDRLRVVEKFENILKNIFR